MNTLQEFHWLRPEWLLGLLPVIILLGLLFRLQRSANNWQQVIAPELLPHLIEGTLAPTRRRGLLALLMAWVICCVALAGPVWEKITVPIHKKESALVILFDLSPSMLAEDIKPSRLVRARHKLIDLLRLRNEGLSALIAYAGEAHVVAPLTDDTATLESLLPALHPSIMPLKGNNPEMAVEKALALLKDAGLQQGDILIVSDEIPSSAASAIIKSLQGLAIRVSILGVGTAEGAPIPYGEGGFAKDSRGNIVIASLNRPTLQHLSAQKNGRYADLRPDNQDLEWLMALPDSLEEKTRELEREFDNWREYGHWLTMLLLPVIAYLFRRGVLICLVFVPLLSLPQKSHAFGWDDLWYTKDQQGQRSLADGKAEQAAKEFENSDWKGTAQYQAGDYESATKSFATSSSANAHYNRGNALARAGKLDKAIDAYTLALETQADFEDAEFNRELVKKLKQEQEKQEQENQDKDKEDKDQENQGEGEQDPQDQDQSGEQEPSDEEGGNSDPQDSNEQQESEKDSEKDSEEDSEKDPEEDSEKDPEEDSEKDPENGKPENQEAEEPQQEGESEPTPQEATESELDPEQQQALEQWLRQVPDDPGGLLRRKFQYQHRQLRKDYQRGDWLPPDNDANERW